MEGSFKFMGNFKNSIIKLFELDEYNAELLSEQDAETLYTYLFLCGYTRTDKKGWINPPLSHFYELVDQNGYKAEIYFVGLEKQVLLIEYNKKKNKVLSKTEFVSKVRYDNIPESIDFGVLYTHNNYQISEYVKAKNYEEFIRCLWHKKELTNDKKEFILSYNEKEPDYSKLMSARSYASKLREQKKQAEKH